MRVTYDPSQITLGEILRVYFSVAHDPTELNRQGPDRGTQYRSAIFPQTPEQARIAKAYIAEINQAHVYNAALVTKIEPGRAFYPAEAYHQDYLTLHPDQPYIVYNDLPKLAELKADAARALSREAGAGRQGRPVELSARRLYRVAVWISCVRLPSVP